MAGEYKISNNFGVMLHCNPAHGKGNKPVVGDIALAPLNVGRVADTMKTANLMATLNVRRLMNTTKAADLIVSDNNNRLSDLETAPAAKPAAKPIIVPPPYEEQDLNIDGHGGLNWLNRLDKLHGALAQGLEGSLARLNMLAGLMACQN
jgi:hypothetical protein